MLRVISIKQHGSFIEITLQHGCYPVNSLLIYQNTFLYKNTSGGLFSVKTTYFWRCLLKLPRLLLVSKSKNAREKRSTHRLVGFSVGKIWFEKSTHFIP